MSFSRLQGKSLNLLNIKNLQNKFLGLYFAYITLPIYSVSASTETVTIRNPLDPSISSIPALFQAIIDILLVFAIPFIVFFIIYSGFLYVSARGNAETIGKAHMALLYALIGGVLILGANVLLTVITGTVTDITG